MKYLIFAVISIGMLLTCTPQTAGTVDDVGSISGQLLTKGDKPVDYTVTVALYKTGNATTSALLTRLKKVRSHEQTLFREIETNTGFYTFDSLPAGEYRIEVSEDEIIVAEKDSVILVQDTPPTDTIHVEAVMSLAFTVAGEQSRDLVIGTTIIENCKISPTDGGYIVKTVKSDDFTFKMVAQQPDLAIDTITVNVAVDNAGTAQYEITESPLAITIAPILETTGKVIITVLVRPAGTTSGIVSFDNKPRALPIFPPYDTSTSIAYPEHLFILLTAEGEDTLCDTVQFNGNLGISRIRAFANLAAPKLWTLHAATRDSNDLPVSEASTSFTTISSESTSADVTLFPNHSTLRFVFVDIPETVGRLQAIVDGIVRAESTLTNAHNDSVTLAAACFPASKAGTGHAVSIQAIGMYHGVDSILYTADTTIDAVTGLAGKYIIFLDASAQSLHAGMKLIPAGTFTMGPDSTDYRSEPIVISRQIALTHDFWMDSTEVTQKEYAELMTAMYPDYFHLLVPDWDSIGWGAGDNYPAHSVNWIDAVLYCNARTKAAGGTDTVYRYESIVPDSISPGRHTLKGLLIDLNKGGFHLPTEAQWEYACRAGTTTSWYFDSALVDQYAWHAGNSDLAAHPVAQKLPNAFGLYDMMGNVREWCNDLEWDYDTTSLIDPTGPDSTPPMNRVQRGDDWSNPPAKSNTRLEYPFISRIPVSGLRACLTER